VAAALRDIRTEPGAAVVASGTGMRTMEALLQVQGAAGGAPILSSNLCSVWSLTRPFGGTASAWMNATLPPGLK
jgi:maleate cis-trans isomerase